jgi:hypothetical protein
MRPTKWDLRHVDVRVEDASGPCRSAVNVARCLQFSSLVFALLGLVIGLSPWSSEELRQGRWSSVCNACVVFGVVPFIGLWLIAWGIRRRNLWAWFMALLVFVLYVLTGFTMFSGMGPLTVFPAALFCFGVFGLACLFSRECRKVFGVN